jgi:ABC-2 type transport system ATP-binding protein
VRVFGHPAGDARSRQQIGYLPEVALYYPFMKARELLELYGGLSGMTRTELRAKIPPVLEKVGLGGRAESLLKNFSKGMQQRLGIAQALLHEPHALVLDELSSGLDPLGRHDLRQVLVELKSQGRTIFFSSHELTEVESLCDRVVIIHRGRIVQQSRVTDLLKPLNQFELTFLLNDGGGLPKVLDGVAVERDGDSHKLMLSDVDLYSAVLTELTHRGCTILRTSSRTRNLEEVFIDLVGASAPAGR